MPGYGEVAAIGVIIVIISHFGSGEMAKSESNTTITFLFSPCNFQVVSKHAVSLDDAVSHLFFPPLVPETCVWNSREKMQVSV